MKTKRLTFGALLTAVAVLIARTPQLIVYLPVLLLVGIPAGAFTGLAAELRISDRLLAQYSNV